MQNITPHKPSLPDGHELLKLLSSSWWQLDAENRDLVARRREPIHDVIAKALRSEHRITVVRSPDESSTQQGLRDEAEEDIAT